MSASASHSVTNTMSNDNKNVKKVVAKKVAAPVAAPAPTPVAAAAADDKKPRGRKPAAKAEVSVPVVAAASSSTETAEVAEDASRGSFTSVVERLREVQSRVTAELKDLVREAIVAAKTATRSIKEARKKRRTKKDPAEMTPEERTAWEARRANNAFLKPRPLTPELCSFMGIPSGSLRSQTDVTRFVSQYVKSHSCFDPANKRRIIADGALSKLLKVTDKDTVTYLNLQSYLKNHFLKPAL
jgi:chromatin remodeling complex protein RSC6